MCVCVLGDVFCAAMSNGGVSAARPAHAPSGRVEKSEERQSVFARRAGLKDTHASGIHARFPCADSMSQAAFGDTRTHADEPQTGFRDVAACFGDPGKQMRLFREPAEPGLSTAPCWLHTTV